ncbi:MAG: type III pantothenate kinase [Salinisphaeraceae bacterium]|nr:type III pantothenate kinase [Salinisphaeraceae bacterium]
MQLLIDAGNTRIKWASLGGTGFVAGRSVPYAQWPDEIRALLGAEPAPKAVWLASVAGAAVNAQIEDACHSLWGQPPRIVSSEACACGVRNAYARPTTLGVDRWLACIEGFHQGDGSVLVVDAGTALTLDFVTAEGRHLGGMIAPGVDTMRRSLRADTQLMPDATDSADFELADNTASAIAAGTLAMAVAVVTQARARLQPARCILTGGEAQRLAPALDPEWRLDTDLVLKGLARLVQSRVGTDG